MPLDKNSLNKFRVNVSPESVSKWTQRRDIPIAILAWIALGLVVLWAVSYVVRTLLVVVVASLLAYALLPAVRLLERFMPRILAIIIVYIGILGTISLLLFFVINTTINEVSLLADNVRYLLTPSGSQHIAPLVKTLNRFGITQSQIDGFGNQIINQAQGITGGVVPLITGVFDFVLDIIIVAVLSIYLLIEGSRFKKWIHTNVPLEQRERAQFLINTFERVIGGYIRGQLTLSILIGVLAFVLEFIPVLGTLTSGALCVLIALTKGWLIALGVLVYFVIVHIFEGDIVGPRIVGKAVGLHPALSLVALIAGAELFGVWGALLAAPIAGLLQALLAAIWQNWRETHPEQFPTNDEPAEQTQVEAVFVQEQEKEEILE